MNNSFIYIIWFLILIIVIIWYILINKNEKDITNENIWQINIEQFSKELKDKNITLIDLRTPVELIQYWKIREDQINIDFYENNFKNKIIALDKTKKYLLYCFHWNRSNLARIFMQKQWFKIY